MTKFGELNVPDPVLDALRDNRLVIFAGAGVSMGAPSNLPSFRQLAVTVANGTALAPKKGEPLDRFLGKLHKQGTAVHELAVQALSTSGSAPTSLHRDLLRLFRTPDRVRLVTTNFDLHFEAAAKESFGKVPPVYSAPALPRGLGFSGIVHLHGSLPDSNELVLTDADFGRAYMTEGWGRRFLVDVFRTYTVLFIGYSHDDTVMNYLARALNAVDDAGRYALSDKEGDWEFNGVTPILYSKRNNHAALSSGIQILANHSVRGALDWKTRLSEIGRNPPPVDDQIVGEVQQAWRDVSTTRFLLQAIRDPAWLDWLDQRGFFNALFADATLDDHGRELAVWLAKGFAVTTPDGVFQVLARQNQKMNPDFWCELSTEMARKRDTPLEEGVLGRWISILLPNTPRIPPPDTFLHDLAQRCANEGLYDQVLEVFLTMSQPRLQIRQGFPWPDESGIEWTKPTPECELRCDPVWLEEVLKKHLMPAIAHVADPVLAAVVARIEWIYRQMTAWDAVSSNYDSLSSWRSAIEPHKEDRFPQAIDVLIDACREALEYLSQSSGTTFDAWLETLVSSKHALLRRLAIHASTAHPTWSPDHHLSWLLKRAELHDFTIRHEIYRAVGHSYQTASEVYRKSIVAQILSHHSRPLFGQTEEECNANYQFQWLSWLLSYRSDCPIASGALLLIKERFPALIASKYPDLTSWEVSVEWPGVESPWSDKELLALDPKESLADLLTFQRDDYDGPSREGLICNLQEAGKQDPSWAIALLRALSTERHWSSDLWKAALRGLMRADLTREQWSASLTCVSQPEVQTTNSIEISNLLRSLVVNGGKPFTPDLISQAKAVAQSIWDSLGSAPEDSSHWDAEDWIHRAINHPAGLLAEFWLNALSIENATGRIAAEGLPSDYHALLTAMIQDSTVMGGVSRAMLCMQASFLFRLDEKWAREYLIPLFGEKDPKRFSQAWDGFLRSATIYNGLIEALKPHMLLALPRLKGRNREIFVGLCANVGAFAEPALRDVLVPRVLSQAEVEERKHFAFTIQTILMNLEDSAKVELWSGWLKSYWGGRLQGVPVPLSVEESSAMLNWLPHLADGFPEAVELAKRLGNLEFERSWVLNRLREHGLATRFPAATAELLIYLAGCGAWPAELKGVRSLLPPLDKELQRRLDEAFAKAGVPD